jgi:pyridinium-3,5-bisthiocarboxylic acid mononucleotide nickel chelatase
MKILYFDCFAGISGDMTIGALLDLGIDKKLFLDEISKLAIGGYKIEISRGSSNSITGTDFKVIIEEHDHSHGHVHRNLDDIKEIINSGDLSSNVKKLSISIFEKIAAAESEVHGVSIDKIHFHEVGAVDSIIDIVGTAVCIDIIKPDKIISSPLHLGTGTVVCAHGDLPVPVPAVVKILKDTPVYSKGVKGELVTPTGAGIIKTIADDFREIPDMIIEKAGFGTGKRNYGITNALRVILGTLEDKVSELKPEKLVMVETNIDDMNPEGYSYIVPRFLEKGALDVFITNIIMKKGRPGVKLNILCRKEDREKFLSLMLEETTTLGARAYTLDRYCLERKVITINTEFGIVKVKAGLKNGKVFKVSPEYEECRKIAEKNSMSIQFVYEKIKETAVKELL